MSKKIIYAVTPILILLIGIFAYFVFHKNSIAPTKTPGPESSMLDYTDNELNTTQDQLPSENHPQDDAPPEDQPLEIQAPPMTDNSSATTEKISPIKEVTGDVLAHITPEHCDNDCNAFKIDLKLYEYCQQSCGISPIKKVTSCDSEKGLEKDYCLKDLAIGKTDATLCEKIHDANIKQACKNRIMQDVIENW